MKDEAREIFSEAEKSTLIFNFIPISLFFVAFKYGSIELLVPLYTGEGMTGGILMTLFLRITLTSATILVFYSHTGGEFC